MIEYTIKLNKIKQAAGLISITLLPQNEPNADPIRRDFKISTERLAEVMSMPSSEDMLVELRKEIVKGNGAFQATWQEQLANKALVIPDALAARVGDEFPVVTQAEAEMVNPAKQSDTTAEVIF